MEEKDYKKLYEDVVALAKDGLKDGLYLSQSAKDVTEFLFPQLKETEDEKVKRELTKFLINFNNGYYSRPSENEIDSWIKWIKKQGEQKTEIKYVYPKFRIGDVIEPINPNGFYRPVRVLSIEEKTKSYYCESDDKKSFSSIPIRCENEYKLVEQKPSWSEEDEKELTEFEKAIKKLIESCCNEVEEANITNAGAKEISSHILDLARKEIEKENPYSGNQKQEWSTEDEKLYTSALWHIKNSCGNGGHDSGEYEVYNWLKSIKDRVQPKQEWSKEDEKKRNGLIKGLEDRMGFGWANQPFTREEYIEWLKSITDKTLTQTNQYDKGYEDGYSAAKYNQWKPKKEELEALRKRTYFCEGIDANLDSLYTNLLKL